MTLRRFLAAPAVLTIALCAPAVAGADVRQGQAADPSGDTPAPAQYDQLAAAVVYDRSVGRIDASTTLAAAPVEGAKETLVSVSLGKVDGEGKDTSCSTSDMDAGVFGLAVFDPEQTPLVEAPYVADPIEDAATASVSGPNVRFVATHPSLTNIDAECARVATWPFGNAGSGVTDETTIYFAGFEPVLAWPKIASTSLRATGGRNVAVRVARGSKPLQTVVELRATRGGRALLARRTVTVSPGTGTQIVTLSLNASARKTLKRSKKLGVRLAVAPKGGPSSTRTLTLMR